MSFLANAKGGRRLGFRSLSGHVALAMLFALCSNGAGLAAVGGGGASNTTFTTSTTHHTTNTRIDLPDMNVYVTQIIGEVQGGATVYDQTFNLAVSDPAVQAGINAARVAITTAGGPGVVILGPTLVASSTTRGPAVHIGNVTVGTNTTVTASTSFGPTTILIGDDQSQSFFVAAGTANINTNTHFETFINNLFQAIVTHYATYQLTGIVQAVGTVHTAVQSSALDLGSRLLRRLAQEGDDPFGSEPIQVASADPAMTLAPRNTRAWAEAYGAWARHGEDGGLPEEQRRSGGVAAGLGGMVQPGIAIGFGADQSWSTQKLVDFSEKADVTLTQIGLYGALHDGNWRLASSVIFGTGDVAATHGSAALGGISRTSYNVSLGGANAEAGYVLRSGAWRIIPGAGVEYLHVETGNFRETGGVTALIGRDHSLDRTRLWAGLDAERTWQTGDSEISLSGRARLVGVVSGRDRTLPVSFVSLPGVPLSIRGHSEDALGAEFGVQASMSLADTVHVYAAYDGTFGADAQSHVAAVGLKITW